MNNNIQYKLCNICNIKTMCICNQDKQKNSSSVKNILSKYKGNWKGKLMSLYIKEMKLVTFP